MHKYINVLCEWHSVLVVLLCWIILQVLKTGGWIDVQQDNAYDDICVLESPKLKQTFAAEVAN